MAKPAGQVGKGELLESWLPNGVRLGDATAAELDAAIAIEDRLFTLIKQIADALRRVRVNRLDIGARQDFKNASAELKRLEQSLSPQYQRQERSRAAK